MKFFCFLIYWLGLLFGFGVGDLVVVLVEIWEVVFVEIWFVLFVILLFDQIDWIWQIEFIMLFLLVKLLEGDLVEVVGVMCVYLLMDVDIVDGVFYLYGLLLYLCS